MDRLPLLSLPGPAEIKSHPFFRGVDWSSLRRDGKAPFRPRVSSQFDTSNFDQFEERHVAPNARGAPPSLSLPPAALGFCR